MNSNLHKAKAAKNDEFYTQLSDIENELRHYKQHFKDKVVFLNCDDPRESNFYVYFAQNFEHLGLKKLIATHYKEDQPTYKLEITRDENGDGKINALDTVETKLKQNGDFRSDEAIAILKEADIVVTNPPFSLFREYIAQLIEHDKKFLVVGTISATTYVEIFPLIKDNKLWLGHGGNISMTFRMPDHYKGEISDDGCKYGKVPGISWWTNLDHKKRHEPLILYKDYDESSYDAYDNYDAIDVKSYKDIPKDYFGVIGVPVSYLPFHNPSQFEILGSNRGVDQDPNKVYGRGSFIDGKETYKRIFIKRK